MWSIYGNEKYFKFLDISLMSAKLMSENIDRFVFKDIDCKFFNENCNIISKKFPSGNASKMAFRYECTADLLENYDYDHVLHVDVDAIIFKDISKIFDKKTNGLSVASESSTEKKYFGHISKRLDFSIGEYWAGPLLNENQKIQYANIPSICMGVWLAGKSEINSLKNIANSVYDYEKSGFNGICLDQHAAVKCLIESNQYNFDLQNHVSHLGIKLNNNNDILDIKNSPISIVHFAGGVQPSEEKFQKMKLFFESIV
jgi:lipopolysaccharide biosynthesis glycosyltransferase